MLVAPAVCRVGKAKRAHRSVRDECSTFVGGLGAARLSPPYICCNVRRSTPRIAYATSYLFGTKLEPMQSDHWHTGIQAINGVSLFCRDWRPHSESTLPVLALHGSLTQSGSWIALAKTTASIRMLCPDQRGFGHSTDPGDETCAAFAADALTLSQSLLPQRIAVMGHSFACSIALEVARLAPDRVAAVVLVDPVVPFRKPPGAAPPPAIAYPETYATLEDAERHFLDTEEGAWPADALRSFVQDIMLRDGENGPWRLPYSQPRLRRLRAFTGSPSSDYNLFTKAPDVRCPVLIIRGGASKRFPVESERAFVEAFASKPDFRVCPDSGHFPANTDTKMVAGAVRDFLADKR